MVMQSGGRKLTYIVMVPVRNFHVECGHCTVKQTYENVLNNVVKVATGSWVLLAVCYLDIRVDFGLCDGGNVNSYLGRIHISMYRNCWYNCYVCCPWIRVLYSFQHWEQNLCQNRTYVRTEPMSEQNPCQNMSVCCSTLINFDFCTCCRERIWLPVYIVWELKISVWWLQCVFRAYIICL
jgi:hypothetical protein